VSAAQNGAGHSKTECAGAGHGAGVTGCEIFG